MVLEEKLPFSSFFFFFYFFLIYINSNLFGAVRKREIKDVFFNLLFYFRFFFFLFFFSFVALNCASSRDGCVGSAVGGQRSCVNGVKWRPV